MEALELVLLLLAAVLVSAVLDQIIPKVSSPLIQIGIGLLIALFAVSPINITFDSELFLVLFIAPLLYDEARNADQKSLWENRGPILSLAIGLVFTSTIVIGFALNAFVPTIPLAAAFAVGAALGPTDAVAVASLPKSVQIGDRRRSILKGESLVNDASGIVAFQFAITAAVVGTFSPAAAVGVFLLAFFGAIVVGCLLGWLSNVIIEWVRGLGLENTTFHVLFDLFTPFIVYLIAEACHTSGIIAVVCAGLFSTATNRAIGPKISRLHIVSSSTWRVFSYALNGVVFVMLGTQLPKALQTAWDNIAIDNGVLLCYAIILTVLVVLVRFVWTYGMEYFLKPKCDRKLFCRETARSAMIMTLGGPKGAVTLAIVLTIPLMVASGDSFPQRELIIFLTCEVILFTLMLSCFCVPLFAQKRNVSDEEMERRVEESKATIEILRKVTEELTARQTPENRRATQSVIHQYNERITRIKNNVDIEYELNVSLRLKTIKWEREFVEGKLARGEVDELVAYDVLSMYERHEDLLLHHTDIWTAHTQLRRPFVTLRVRWRKMRHRIPWLTVSEESEQKRHLRIEAIEHVIHRLREEVPEDTFKTEDVTAVIFEYQRILGGLRSTENTVGITGLTRTQSKAVGVKREAYRIELEAIQDMYEEGRIGRACARRLRENVNLMQIDLEDRV